MASAGSIYTQLQKLSNQATEKTLNFNREEANTARAWQKEMSDTSHQREVKDLIKAGLNPVLSAGGSGAQSYTTSAASGQAENAANAVASAYGADQSAAATRAAAASSAAATKYAADQNLRAAQAAAYANMYSADKHYEGVKYSTKYSKSGSIPGVITNVLGKVFGSKEAKIFSKEAKDFFSTDKYKRISGAGYSWLNLTKIGQNKVDNAIKGKGLDVTNYTRTLYIQGILNGKESYARKLNNLLSTTKKVNSSAYRFYRAGSGIW